ncbi:MAG: magnesium and cobalt transport protein CorA [Candidatus Nephthysia bennettiae]|uniref:Magnesium transport protein CorA n=1 Tax=Candidatus Nephthysia bennettiae TaxID=3127016 RepID=A0A934KDP8_9BACT|nr:magnesium/cobalt transporter CorA [Candidatus Dormibacteraeota bacterium]MBJ7611104.1 magnesium/cobalt transporter CorA [Candidatus Dormibacteraeota bacterium]PZR99540.1 MAG: magnesium and cobalt transport protein CorA [Candidatus Dormibacteraeota bacterium]
MRTLFTFSGEISEPDDKQIAARHAKCDQDGFWLDIQDPTDADYSLLLDVFHYHRLTVEDIQQENARPKLEQYRGYLFAIVFTARLEESQLGYQEQHLYFSKNALVTVHHGPAPEITALMERFRKSPDLTQKDPSFLEYLVVNELTEGMFAVLDQLDDRIDSLEDQIIERPTSRILSQIYKLKHDVIELRRILGAQREVFQHLVTHAVQFHSEDTSVYYRDVYDHVVRQYETVDSLRDLLTGSMDVYLSTVSNRLNGSMRQLTVIASLFLPLTFLTGFFGMNFAFLVGKIMSPFAFAGGVSVMLASTAIQLYIFHRRGWI